MKVRCDDFLDGLISTASGNPDLAAEAHVQECSKCAHKLAQFRQIVARSQPTSHAPAALIQAARELMPETTRRARLVLDSLALGGVRRQAVADGTQLVFEADGQTFRIMLSEESGRCAIFGRLPGPNWEVEAGDQAVSANEDGEFEMSLESWNTPIVLVGNGQRFELPLLSEVLRGDHSGPA